MLRAPLLACNISKICNVPIDARVLLCMKATPHTIESRIKASLIKDLDNGFTEMVKEYQPNIYSGARRLTAGTHDAQDVAQDTFVRAYKALHEYGPDRIAELRLRPWLWTIALNLCRNRARSRVTEHELRDHDGGGTDDPETFDDTTWRIRLGSLNDPQRTAVVLRYVLDLPIAEIAEITGRPEGTVKADISRGLDRLRLTMEAEVLNAR